MEASQAQKYHREVIGRQTRWHYRELEALRIALLVLTQRLSPIFMCRHQHHHLLVSSQTQQLLAKHVCIAESLSRILCIRYWQHLRSGSASPSKKTSFDKHGICMYASQQEVSKHLSTYSSPFKSSKHLKNGCWPQKISTSTPTNHHAKLICMPCV